MYIKWLYFSTLNLQLERSHCYWFFCPSLLAMQTLTFLPWLPLVLTSTSPCPSQLWPWTALVVMTTLASSHTSGAGQKTARLLGWAYCHEYNVFGSAWHPSSWNWSRHKIHVLIERSLPASFMRVIIIYISTVVNSIHCNNRVWFSCHSILNLNVICTRREWWEALTRNLVSLSLT